MKKNLYYRNVIRRENLFNKFVFGFFLGFASYPRLLLETFLRKNFGERYFKLSSAITVAVILLLIPFIAKAFGDVSMMMGGGDGAMEMDMETGQIKTSSFLKPYYSWFAFIALFLGMSYLRWKEIKRNPSVYDFAKYSLYSGDIHPVFSNFKTGENKLNTRLIETVLEPLPFLILGILLYFLGQKLGVLLIVSSIFYCMSYVAAYDYGDNFVMDKIDEIIANEELKKSFVDGLDDKQTRGFRFIGHVPENPEHRKQILPLMIDENDEGAVLS